MAYRTPLITFLKTPRSRLDLDFDGLGNNADDDDDGDGVLDEDDAFRFNPFETVDSDGDGVGDFVDAAPNNGDVTSLVISEALAGIIDTNLRACLANRTQGLAYAGELTELVCGYDLGESIEVYDLTGLRAFHQLTYIELKRGAPTSLEPIHGLYKLQRLRLNNLAWDFHDFDQLAPFYSLTEFGSDSFQNVQPEELEILGRLPRLTNLSVGSYFSLKTLSFVSKMPRLRQLWISYSEIEDYSQLESLYYLKTLWLDFKAGPKFSDLSFLTFSPNLKELGLGGANLEGLTGIEQARNLENLTAWEGPISDIAVLADLAHLKNLNLFQQRISDITPLAGLQQLETVNLAENNLSSLGTVLINWGYPTSFDLSGNPLPCSEIEAARTNANLTIQFDGDCLKIGEDADADNDGISDESDAFPNDPAASVDTDGDGKPDDWNEGKSAADSTSDPALVLDDDDDWDGILDVDDTDPKTLTLQSAFNYAQAIDGDLGLQACIAGLEPDFPGGWTEPVSSWKELRCEGEAEAKISAIGAVAMFVNLTKLSLAGNKIEDISPIVNLSGLVHLSLNYNPVAALPSGPYLSNLIDLHLSGSQISNYSAFSELAQIQALDLESQPSFSGAEMAGLETLRLFAVRNNRISDLTPFSGLQNAYQMGFNENDIVDLAPLSAHAARLDLGNIYLQQNNISDLSSLSQFSSGIFYLNGNPVDCQSLAVAQANSNITVVFDGDCLNDVEDPDSDVDGISDENDAFPDDPAASVDTDGDGKPDDWNEGKSAADSTSNPALVLDDDDDNDGVKDINDDYPLDPTRTIFDIDSDGVRDALDNCPNIANADQLDLDGDGDGDLCDTNRDGDSCPDAEDAYPSDPARCEKGLQKAIVVAGGGPYRENFLWEATERMAELAITTLRGQGIPREQILYLSAGFGKNDVPDGPATLESIEAGIIDWAGDVNEPADDVLLYLVDHGGPETFELAKKTLLSASELDGWLDTLQANTAASWWLFTMPANPGVSFRH